MTHQHGILHIFLSLRRSLGRAVRGIVPPGEVEDIVQETYVRACQINAKDAMVEPKALLFKVARNLALDYAKRAETRLVIRDENRVEPHNVADLSNEMLSDAISREEFADFCEAVRKLPLQRRRAFVLKKVYGFTQREIATEMKLSEKTVERHIALAMEDCLNRLGMHGRATGAKSRKGSAARAVAKPPGDRGRS